MKSTFVSALTLIIASSAFAAGGSHSGTFNPYVATQTVASDSTGFSVVELKQISVPTFVTVTGEPCLSSDEYAQNCEQAKYTIYKDAYRLTVGYTSNNSNLSSDEYPQSNNWTADFVFPAEVINSALAKTALTSRGVEKKSALQGLVAKFVAAPSLTDKVVQTKGCETVLVGETEFRKVDPSCQDEFEIVRTTSPAPEMNLTLDLVK